MSACHCQIPQAGLAESLFDRSTDLEAAIARYEQQFNRLNAGVPDDVREIFELLKVIQHHLLDRLAEEQLREKKTDAHKFENGKREATP